jgi:hypothetical protein
MEDTEEYKTYFDDCFLSTAQFNKVKKEEGNTTERIGELTLNTGIKEGGSVLMDYNNIIFNPLYSELITKVRLSGKKNILAFFGFKENLTEPKETMTESHAGFLVSNGKVYVSTGNGANQQKTHIQGLDLTKVYEYKIKYNEFYIKPLPSIVTYLGLPIVKEELREFKMIQKNTNYKPKNQVHYIVFFIKNTTGEEKYLRLERVIYKENYPE